MKHLYGRDCPCNPYIVSVGEPIKLTEPVTIVATEPMMNGMLVHVERDSLIDGRESNSRGLEYQESAPTRGL